MADEAHADATPVEVISPEEAQQRVDSGGFLANGEYAPREAVVDTAQGPMPTQAAPKPRAAAAESEEEYWAKFDRKPTAKGAKSPKAKDVDPEVEYWSQFGDLSETLPAPPPPPAPKPSMWRAAVDRIGSFAYSGLKGDASAMNAGAGALNTVAAPLVQSVEAWKQLLTGKVRSIHQDAPTDWQDTWFKNTVDPTVEHAKDFAMDESAPFVDKASHALGATLGYLSQAILTGGAGGETTATTTGMDLAAHGIKAAQAPAITQAINVGREAYQSTGDAKLAFKLAATTYGFSVVQNAGPIAMPGKLATRLASGGAIAGLGGEAEREATNAEIPDNMSDHDKRALPDDQLAQQNQKEAAYEDLRQPFSPEGAVMNLLQGAAMGGIAGPRGAMPHQAVERGTTIMEHAQQVAAAEAKANGGDLLDQTVAATHANSVLGAHHDAAEYEGNMEVRNQQAAQEAEVAQQEEARAQAEQAQATAAAPETPTTLFERREQEQAKKREADKDADFDKALNQKGDQEIARGDTLEAGAEKGGSEEPGPTLADTLSPDQLQAFQSLKERRAAAAGEEKPVADLLKAQNPEDNFTPFVAKKATTPEPPTSLAERRAQSPLTDMSKSKEDRALERERAAAERAREEGLTPQFEPEPIPPRAAETEGEAARRDAADRVEAAAKESAYSPENDLPTPTQAQYEAGNYQKGHVDVQGMPVTIEHPAGSERPLGNGETRTMEAHYGYVKGTVAADGQHVDMLLGKNPANETHFIVDHMNGEGYEQAKVLTGFDNKLQALRAYRKAYPDNPMGPVTEMKTPQLKEWLEHGDTRKPVDLRGVNRMADSRFSSRESNASGESAASLEAISRQRQEQAAGQTRHLVDPDGNSTPLAGVDAVDQKAPPGHLIVQKGVGEGAHTILDRGGLAPMHANGLLRRAEAKGIGEPARARDTAPAARRGMTKDDAATAIKPLLDKVGAHNVQVHDDPTTLPDKIQKDMKDQNHPNPRGVYDPTTDTVHVVAGNHDSPDDIFRTTVHELAHQGLRRMFDSGSEYQGALRDIYANIHDHVTAVKSPMKGVNKTTARAWIKDYMQQHRLDARNPRHQALAADEYVAHLAEHDASDPNHENPSILRRAIDAVRAGLRKLGAVREWTDNDIRRLLRESNANLAAENAGIRESALNRGQGARFADREDPDVQQLAPDHPIAVGYKYGRTMEDQANYNPGFVRSRMDALETTGAKSKDHVLGMISLHNLPDFIDNKLMPSARAFSRMIQRLDGRRGQLMEEKTHALRDWETWGRKNKEMDKSLKSIMGGSTLGGVDPSKPFESRYSAEELAKNPDRAAHNEMQKSLHRELKRDYDALDSKGREIYTTVRDHYVRDRETTMNALEQRVMDDAGGNENSKRQLVATLRQQFEAGKVQGPYFPLARFGDRWAAVKDTDGNVLSYSRFETKAQQRAWLAQRRTEGFTEEQLSGGQRADAAGSIDQIDPRFVAKITDMVRGMDPSVADEIWQEYLKHLPEMSMRKSNIHRLNRLGYSADQLRAFANNSFHNAHQIARLEYGHKMDGILRNMETERKAVDSADPTSSDADWANAMNREFGKRYEWIKNPRSNALSSALTKFGSAWYLGWNPATAFRIAMQNPMIAVPTLGGEHGYIGTFKELTTSMYQWIRHGGALGDSLRGDERAAFDSANDMGVFSNNYAAMLASGGTGQPMYTGTAYHVTKAAQFMFNGMEHLNRQSTYLAAYRLARTQGMTHENAVYHAADMARLSHFDYCVDTETECLTTRGWLKFDELKEGDLALATDETGKAVLSAVEAVNIFPGTKEVVEFSNGTRFNFAVTAGHRNVIRSYNSRDKKWQKPRLVRTDELKRSHHLLRAPLASLAVKGQGHGADFAALVGWFTSDGSMARFRGCDRRSDCRIYQSRSHNPEYVAEIDALLMRLGGEFRRYEYPDKNIVTWVINGELRKRLVAAAPDKVLSFELLFELTANERDALLDAFCKGDGSALAGGGWVIAQAPFNAQNLEVLLAAATASGRQATLKDECLIISASKTNSTHVASLKRKNLIVDTVWCPTTTTGTWVARRRGAVFVTGNSNANRPRVLQSNTMKVIGLFKSYSAGVTYRLAREFREMTTLETQDPGERMKAFKTFAGMMAGTTMFAGVTGVPFAWLAFYAMNKAFGDKDQPFDSKAALHEYLSEQMGHTAADAVMTGPMGAATGATLSTGASYSDLWYKEPQKDMSPGEQWGDAVDQALGAVPAIATNAVAGIQLMGQDHIERGLEHFVPPAMAGLMKAWRYSHEGVTNLQGEQIISPEELSGWEIALQAANFTPQKVTDARSWAGARKNLEKSIMDRRELLLNRFDTAVRNGDSDEITKASEDLARFAQKNPGVARDMAKTETSSAMSRAKKDATSVAGANLNPGLRNLDSIYGSTPFTEPKEGPP